MRELTGYISTKRMHPLATSQAIDIAFGPEQKHILKRIPQ